MLNRALVLMAAALATPAFAQDTQTTTETPQATTEAPAAAPEAAEAPSDLNMGTTESDGPQLGDFYVRQTFDDWALRCLKTEEEADPCQLYQLLLDDEGSALAEINLFPLRDGGEAAAGATIVVPLETLLTENLKLSVDGGAARVYPYSFCNALGCVARVGLTQADIAALKGGNEAKLTMVPAAAPEEIVSVTMSLKGFTAAFDNDGVQ